MKITLKDGSVKEYAEAKSVICSNSASTFHLIHI